MAAFVQLSNPPIKEIIFTISFNEKIDLSLLDEFKSLPHISQKFRHVRKGIQATVERNNSGEGLNASFMNDGYILADQDRNRVLQVKQGSFAFHKVREYEKFETLLREFGEYWTDLKQCTGTLTVNRISIRYLNFIEKDPDQSVEELIIITPKHPFAENTMGLVNLKFPYRNDDNVLVNIVTAAVIDGLKEGVILDIIIQRPVENKSDSAAVFKLLSELRDVKNDLFFKSITEKTVKKYI